MNRADSPVSTASLRDAVETGSALCPVTAPRFFRRALAGFLIAVALPALSSQTLAQSNEDWAALILEGRSALETGDPALALQLFEEAEPAAETPDDQIVSLTSLGLAHASLGNLDAAARFHERSLDLRETQYPPPSMAVATGLRNLAQVRHRQARLAETATLLNRVLTILNEIAPDTPDVTDVKSDLAAVYVNMARYRDAETLYESVLPVVENGSPAKHVAALSGLAAIKAALGQNEAAAALYLKALDIARAKFGDDHPSISGLMNGLGEVYRASNRPAEARDLYQTAIDIRAAALGSDHPALGPLYNNLGLALLDLGDLDGAGEALENARVITEGALGPNHPSLATVLANQADLDEARGEYLSAIEHNLMAFRNLASSLGTAHPEVQRLQVNLGRRLSLAGDYARAEETLNEAEAGIIADRGGDHIDMIAVHSARGQLERLRGDNVAALESYAKALAIVEAADGATTMDAAVLYANQAKVLVTLRREEEAVALLEESLAIREATFGDDSPALIETLNDYAFALRRLRRFDEAEAVEARVASLSEP
ncbi:MAG: tetratricopeptide repeat protein [Pseudomonadota bacterium]